MKEQLGHLAGQYITFVLGREEYGIALNRVHEILGPDGIQDADMERPCLKGVLKLRGQKVQVLDLLCYFQTEGYFTKNAGAVLVTALGSEGEMLGLWVEAIRQVLHVDLGCLRPALLTPDDPRMGFIVGLAKIQDRTITLLSFDKGFELLPNLPTH
jgi:purine-binding chemotaxis protein CheW